MINIKSIFSLICLSAAALTANAGSWQNNQSVGGFDKVHIYTPDTLSSVGDGRALLVVLHGCTQSVDAYLTANLEDAAETYGMVIAVPDAMNKAGFGCWSYWQGSKSRTSGDYKNLISLANALSTSTSYNIDSNQVYIAGLSSGAAFANTTACIAPDVFAGMGISAGPSIGTSSSGAIGTCEYASVAQRCEQYAGSYDSYFDSQIASIAHGDADTTVDQCYNRQNAEGMADVYNVIELPGSTVIGSGARTAQEFLWEDGRVSMLWFNGIDHAWSGGQGASGSYVNGNGINYAMYLGQYFLENNARVDRNEAPVVTAVMATVNGSQIAVSGNISDSDGTVDEVFVQLRDDADNVFQYTDNTVSSGSFSVTSASLADALYFVSVNASDNNGAVSDTVTDSVRVGPPPPDTPPALSNIQVTVSGQCAEVNGEVVDINQNLASVAAAFSSGAVTADVSGTLFTVQACDLPGGEQSVTVTATDTTALSSVESLTFTIDAGQIATLDGHIAAGRLDYTNYANCYLEYSTNTFKLNEFEVSGGQCQWQDNDNSCAGPVQNCSSSTPSDPGNDGGDGDSDECASYTTANYYHKVAGRAYSTGNYYTPDYFAIGSDDPMNGSTWGSTTLSSLNGEAWYTGNCP